MYVYSTVGYHIDFLVAITKMFCQSNGYQTDFIISNKSVLQLFVAQQHYMYVNKHRKSTQLTEWYLAHSCILSHKQ